MKVLGRTEPGLRKKVDITEYLFIFVPTLIPTINFLFDFQPVSILSSNL